MKTFSILIVRSKKLTSLLKNIPDPGLLLMEFNNQQSLCIARVESSPNEKRSIPEI